jgi:hypothetical protein
MTPLQIAHAHCANWRKDNDACLGAIIDDDLQIRRCIPKPRCVVGTPGQRCQYFEECVLPMARSIHDPNYRQQFEEGVRQYRLAANIKTGIGRPCPVCGRWMEPGRRFCPVCAAAKRRASTRAAMAKQRVRCEQLAEKAPLVGNDLQGR